MAAPTLHTTEQAAAHLNVHPATLKRNVREGRWPATKLGPRTWRWTDDQLAEIVHISTQPAKGTTAA